MHVHATLPLNFSFHQAHSITVTVTCPNTSIRTPAPALLAHQYLLKFLQLAVNALFHSLVAYMDVFTVLISPTEAVSAHLQPVLQVSPSLSTLHLVYVATPAVTQLLPMEFAQNAEQVIVIANIAKRHMFMMDSNANMDH